MWCLAPRLPEHQLAQPEGSADCHTDWGAGDPCPGEIVWVGPMLTDREGVEFRSRELEFLLRGGDFVPATDALGKTPLGCGERVQGVDHPPLQSLSLRQSQDSRPPDTQSRDAAILWALSGQSLGQSLWHPQHKRPSPQVSSAVSEAPLWTPRARSTGRSRVSGERTHMGVPPRRDSVSGLHRTLNLAPHTAAALRAIAERTGQGLSKLVTDGLQAYIDGEITTDTKPPAGGSASIGVYINPALVRQARVRLTRQRRSMPWLLHQLVVAREQELGARDDAIAAAIKRAGLADWLPPEGGVVVSIQAIAYDSWEPVERILHRAATGLTFFSEGGGHILEVPVAERLLLGLVLAPGGMPPGVTAVPDEVAVLSEAVHLVRLAFPRWEIHPIAELSFLVAVLARLPIATLRVLSSEDFRFPGVETAAVAVLRALFSASASVAQPDRRVPEAVVHDQRLVIETIASVLCDACRSVAAAGSGR